MKLFKYTVMLLAFLFATQSATASAIGDRDEALDMFKTYINTMVQKVEKAKKPAKKREILNNSFDEMTAAFDKALSFGVVSKKDRKAINTFKADIEQKKNELNGLDGYKKVANNNLNDFANYVQQDLEQADTVTFSISAVLLVLIIILLLLV